jgi:chromosome segregation ATPase
MRSSICHLKALSVGLPDPDHCLCGASMLNSAHKFIAEKKKEFENYKPAHGSAMHKEGLAASSSYQQDTSEKDNIIKELQDRNENLMAEVNKARLTKAHLDSKFLESALFEDLSKQLLDVVGYSMTLKNHLDRAEKNLTEIQTRRNQELFEIYDKTNDEKQRLNSQISQLQRDVGLLRDKNAELIRKIDKQVTSEDLGAQANHESGKQTIESLSAQIQALTNELAQEKDRLRHEHHRVYKYEKELQTVKENHYNELLNKYQVCENMAMRHTRHEDIFNKLYKLNSESNAGIKDDLDELTKYVKTRDEKISHLDKKWKKCEKELDAERKQCQNYIKEIENATLAYTQMTKENEQYRKEINEMNSNFNKVYKEKTAEKQLYDFDIAKLQTENKFLKEQVPTLKSNVSSLTKNLSSKDKLMVHWTQSA